MRQRLPITCQWSNNEDNEESVLLINCGKFYKNFRKCSHKNRKYYINARKGPSLILITNFRYLIFYCWALNILCFKMAETGNRNGPKAVVCPYWLCCPSSNRSANESVGWSTAWGRQGSIRSSWTVCRDFLVTCRNLTIRGLRNSYIFQGPVHNLLSFLKCC